MVRFVKTGLGATAAAAVLAFAGGAFAQDKEIVFGFQCDRTGPTATVGTVLCPGYHDYIGLINSKGGVEGYKIRVIEVDNEYKVPPAIEAHERFKKEGAVLEGLYGTPQTAALKKKLVGAMSGACMDDGRVLAEYGRGVFCGSAEPSRSAQRVFSPGDHVLGDGGRTKADARASMHV